MKIEEVDGEELVKKFAEEMEEMLGRKMKSVKVIKHSVTLYGNQFDMQKLPCLNHDYGLCYIGLNHLSYMGN